MILTIQGSWKQVLASEFKKPYFQDLKAFLVSEVKQEKILFPPISQIFEAFNSCPFDQVKVVILGQDPYHGTNQAHGLCFSVNKGIKVPPSLQNIYKELQSDLGCVIPNHGNLTFWAQQGVLLLNSTLTVESGKPNSHKAAGWDIFTDKVIEKLSDDREELVFLLWGNFAKQKKALINTSKHTVLESTHPSPFSVHRGFSGCKHFSQANNYLQQVGKLPIDWQIV